MQDYLSDLTRHPDCKRINSLTPEAICPFLFYNLAPYIFTLAAGGWFDWVVRTPRPTRRRPVTGKKTTRNINRLYPNEVLVGCPRPDVDVTVGVGPWDKGRVCLRFIHSDSRCPQPQHRPGLKIILTKEDAARALTFYHFFPRDLLTITTGISPAAALTVINDNNNLIVKAAKTVFPCRFHPRLDATPIKLLPDNMCLYLFWYVYPWVMARMYNAVDIRLPLRVPHPENPEQQLTVTVEKTPLPQNPAVRTTAVLIDLFCKLIRHPLERLDYTLAVKVLRHDDCHCRLKEGHEYRVNLDNPHFLCPAALHSLYPCLLLTAAGASAPWTIEGHPSLAACPDCVGTIYTLEGRDTSKQEIKNHPAPGSRERRR